MRACTATIRGSWRTAGGFTHNPLLHGTVQFIATSFVFRVLGASDATLRFLPALLGVIVVALPYLLFRHKMGTWGALIASGLLAISPGVLYFSRFARNDIYIVLITLLLFWTMWAYMDTRRLRYLVIASATLAVGFATKEIMYLLVLVPITFLLIAHLPDVGRAYSDAVPRVASGSGIRADTDNARAADGRGERLAVPEHPRRSPCESRFRR